LLDPITTPRSESWFETPDGSARGYIDAHGLRELWFHCGTACNLSCAFCLEGSKPGDRRLELIKLRDVEPYIEDALTLGVEQFSFTGGEPFVAKDIVKILGLAARHRPCLVLTNGTKPLRRRIHELAPLQNSANAISFRVSFDHPDEKQHDLFRGAGAFAEALDGLKQLHGMGFTVSIARQMRPDEDTEAITRTFTDLFRQNGLPEDLAIVAFPDFAAPGSAPNVPAITTGCMTQFHTAESRRQFMCAFSRMVVKQGDRMRVYACTLVDDDREYDLGSSLAKSMCQRISMKHHRCYSCFSYGASCSEL